MLDGEKDPAIIDARKSGVLTGGPSFALSHRLHRAIFGIAWLLFARWTPRALHRWRAALLNLFGAQVHPTARIYPSVKVWYPPNLAVGRNATIAPDVNCYSMATITVGAQATVSQGTHLCAGSHDIHSTHFQLHARPIVINRLAWIAAEAFIGPGVTIGEGAVLGARAVAFSDLERLGVYTGNPARQTGQRATAIVEANPE